MSTKKYLSLDRLEEYDALIKEKIDNGDSSILTDAKTYTDGLIDENKTYVDNAVAQKSQVQIITWEADD